MIKRQWIEAGRDKASRLNALPFFLGADVAEPRVYQEAVSYRVTGSALKNVSLGALVVWLRKGELEADKILTAPYDQRSFRRALTQIRSMTGKSPIAHHQFADLKVRYRRMAPCGTIRPGTGRHAAARGRGGGSDRGRVRLRASINTHIVAGVFCAGQERGSG